MSSLGRDAPVTAPLGRAVRAPTERQTGGPCSPSSGCRWGVLLHGLTARLGMLFALMLLPNVLQIFSALLVWSFPLEQRAQRSARSQLQGEPA